MGISFPRWYRPVPPISDPIIADPITVEVLHSSYVPRPKNSVRDSNTQSQRPARRVPSIPQMKPPVLGKQIDPVEHPSLIVSKPVNTKVRLPKSDFLFVGQTKDESHLQELISDPVKILSELEQPHRVEIKRGFSQKKQEVQAEIDSEPQTINRDAQIGTALETIAGDIARGSSSTTVDIVFLLDTSGSMEDNIRAVGSHLIDMVEIFQEKGIDFTMGIVKFKHDALIFPQTREYQKYERLLENVRCGGDERAYDAIVKSIARVKFRTEAERRFILVTDEPCKGSYKISVVLKRCREAQIKLDLIGIDEMLQKYLANQTGGLWFPIPGG